MLWRMFGFPAIASSMLIFRCCVGICFVLFSACGKSSESCESGLCPSGFACNPGSGVCEIVSTGSAASSSGLLGRLAPVSLADGSIGVGAFSTERTSLVWASGTDGSWLESFIAGPAATAQELPAGQNVVAAVDAQGRPHLAWRRSADATLWHAVLDGSGWHREQVTVAATGTVGAAIGLGLWQGQPVLAWRALDIQNVRVARKINDGWLLETLPPPTPLPGEATSAVDLGRALALVVLPTGPVIAAYEAGQGDLVLAARTGDTWNVERVAGVDPKTGANLGDTGMPVAATVGPGGELVLVYRERESNQVFLRRAKTGLKPQLVLDGASLDPVQQTARTDLLGTVLSVAVLPTGRVVVAAQDGSGMRVRVASERPAGGFQTYLVPGQLQGWPALVVAPDATVRCLWLDLSDHTHPAFGHLRSWTVPREGP